jgi:uncharacterized protein (DUF4415 family)
VLRKSVNTLQVTTMSEDFSQGKRGPVVRADSNKTRITIRLDNDLIEHFKKIVDDSGGGNYQTLINNALREFVENDQEDLELRLRRIIREELKQAS